MESSDYWKSPGNPELTGTVEYKRPFDGGNMNKEEQKLFNSKTPHEYIDNSLKVKLSPGRKAHITKLWLEKKKNYSIEDIQYARNRHPYWKSRKMQGSYERNEQRRMEHDYSSNLKLDWDRDAVMEFIAMNKKDERGRYEHKDFELAKHFRTSIPSIQHYRRKYNMAMVLMEREGLKPTGKRIYDYINQSESILRRLTKSGRKGKRR